MNKTDFLGRSKIWIVQFNLLKKKFSNKMESDRYLTDDFEDLYRDKLRKEKRNKRLKMVIHKRKNTIRKAQANQLIREHIKNLKTYQNNKRIVDKKQTNVALYTVNVARLYDSYNLREEVRNGIAPMIGINGYPLYFTGEQITDMNQLMWNCYYISTRNSFSVFDPLFALVRNPDIDDDIEAANHICLKWDLIEEIPCTLR